MDKYIDYEFRTTGIGLEGIMGLAERHPMHTSDALVTDGPGRRLPGDGPEAADQGPQAQPPASTPATAMT